MREEHDRCVAGCKMGSRAKQEGEGAAKVGCKAVYVLCLGCMVLHMTHRQRAEVLIPPSTCCQVGGDDVAQVIPPHLGDKKDKQQQQNHTGHP